MQLYYLSNDKSEIAFIADTATNPAPVELSSAAFAEMQYITSVKGQRSFWTLLDWVIADNRIKSIAVSLNYKCVFDNELPSRLEQACTSANEALNWAVLAGTGKCVNGATYSVVYPSAAPRIFSLNIPRPIVDCGLDIFIVNADFLRASRAEWEELEISPDSFAHWCILAGYLEGRTSIFCPELAIGVDGEERARDMQQHTLMLQQSFSGRLPDDAVPSLMGDLPLAQSRLSLSPQAYVEKSAREKAISRPVASLTELVQRAVTPACKPMSLSVITRTRFTRQHLIRRMLSTLTRARQNLKIDLEVVLTTDINSDNARTAHTDLRKEFPELDLVLQLNSGRYPHSRVDNLLGGIMAASKDYVTIMDDDDYVEFDALKAISTARFLDRDPLLIMSSQVCNETWRETGSGRWILESAKAGKVYNSVNARNMFTGTNQLPVCAMVAPRHWVQSRLENISLRHDLSEDYTVYLALLTAPDLPPLLMYSDVFCMISVRPDGSNTVTMTDRRPWVRDITLFLHDMFVVDRIPGTGVAQIMGQGAKAPKSATKNALETMVGSKHYQQGREIALLKAEVEHLRGLLASKNADP